MSVHWKALLPVVLCHLLCELWGVLLYSPVSECNECSLMLSTCPSPHHRTAIHSLQLSRSHVDWYSDDEVYLYSDATTSKIARTVTQKLGFSKGELHNRTWTVISFCPYTRFCVHCVIIHLPATVFLDNSCKITVKTMQTHGPPKTCIRKYQKLFS